MKKQMDCYTITSIIVLGLNCYSWKVGTFQREFIVKIWTESMKFKLVNYFLLYYQYLGLYFSHTTIQKVIFKCVFKVSYAH